MLGITVTLLSRARSAAVAKLTPYPLSSTFRNPRFAMSSPTPDKMWLPPEGKDASGSFYHSTYHNQSPLSDIEWDWSDADMESWTKEEKGWASSLCQYWRRPKPAIILPDGPADLPNVLCLGTDLDFPPPMGNRILVTQAYEDLFRRLLVLRKRDVGSARGAVVTGQPGTGTSMNRPPPVRQLIGGSVLQGKLPS